MASSGSGIPLLRTSIGDTVHGLMEWTGGVENSAAGSRHPEGGE